MLTLMATSSFADSSSDGGQSNVLNGQVNLNSQQANLFMSASNTAGNISGGAAAGGNQIDITTMNNTDVTNNQYVQAGGIASNVQANLTNVGGTTDLSSQAVCNQAGISMDPTSTNVYSNQECNANDPSAQLTANIANTNNDVNLASAAVSNTFEEDTNAPNGSVQNYQINHAAVNATVTSTTANVNGNLTATSSAIGNTGQIIHYSTGN